MIHIENKRYYRGNGIYIGRPSLLGNPFVIGRDGTRLEVVSQYRRWLWLQIKLRGKVYYELRRIGELARRGDVALICWCKEPCHVIPCHGDVVKSAIEWMNCHVAPAPEMQQQQAAKSKIWLSGQRYWLALLSEPV
jgi:Domain of unknown function (DUF4326)